MFGLTRKAFDKQSTVVLVIYYLVSYHTESFLIISNYSYKKEYIILR